MPDRQPPGDPRARRRSRERVGHAHVRAPQPAAVWPVQRGGPWPVNLKLLDLGRAPYVLYGVKYIDLVSLTPDQRPLISKSYTTPLFFNMACKQNLDSRCILSQHLGVLGPKHVSNRALRSLRHIVFTGILLMAKSVKGQPRTNYTKSKWRDIWIPDVF